MNGSKAVAPIGVALLGLSFIASPACAQSDGDRYDSAWEHYQALKEAADGGTVNPSFDALPDWTGFYTRARECTVKFESDVPCGELGVTRAVLTQEGQTVFDEKMEKYAQGIYFDYLSECLPAGHPRWLTEPFLREFIVRPEQTLLINEQVSEVRRVYTDGREHTPPELEGPLWEGDSIGFWDGDTLVVHTQQLRAGEYQRTSPNYSDQVETVERWYKDDDGAIIAEVWIYDPVMLAEPWHETFTYEPLDNPLGDNLRIRMFSCAENPNNDVIQADDGRSTYSEDAFVFSRDK